MLEVRFIWFCIVLPMVCFQCASGYRKYYIEDECMPSDKKQRIIIRLPASGADSVGEIRSNRFGTYSRTERNCVLKLIPPEGYGVTLTILKIDFRNLDSCKDFIKILSNDDEEEKLCGYRGFSVENQTYSSDEDIRIVYHTSDNGMGFNNGIRLIFTVTKLGKDGCTSPEEFRCRNSQCIWAGVTCDGVNNCGDASDENSFDYPFCSTYLKISKNIFSLLAEISPLAITAVVLGIASLTAIIVIMCICCCRGRPEQPEKPLFYRDFLSMHDRRYIPLPGYNYGSTSYNVGPVQRLHSYGQPSVPFRYPYGYSSSSVPLIQQKVEIRCERPPPYDG